MKKIAIIGAGVNGLASGVELLQNNHSVTIYANDQINTASSAAGGFWTQFKAYPTELIAKWMQVSLAACRELAKDSATGVDLLPFEEFYREDLAQSPWLAPLNYHHQKMAKENLPYLYQCGFSAQTYRLDTSLFLPYLQNKFISHGGKMEQRFVTNFSQLNEEIIINCTGAYTNYLTDDNEAFPIRGQYILIDKIKNQQTIKLCFVDETKYLAFVPRRNDCWLGGTINPHTWDVHPDSTITQFIINGIGEFIPEVKTATIHLVKVGFRSGKPRVRVEKETLPSGKVIIHNYGHGGSGISLSFGCAQEVVNLVAASQ